MSHLPAEQLECYDSNQELISLQLYTWPAALHHDTMGGADAFPKLRVFKTQATLGSFQEADMPVLESLEFSIVAQSNDDGISFGFDFRSLGNLPLLKEVIVTLYAPPADHKKARETAKRAIDVLPNRLRHYIILEDIKKLEVTKCILIYSLVSPGAASHASHGFPFSPFPDSHGAKIAVHLHLRESRYARSLPCLFL